MKRKLFYSTTVILLLIATIVSCRKEPVRYVTFSTKSVEILVGQTTTLIPEIVPPEASNKKVTWSTEDSNVAIVENGVVTGVAMGRTTITVTTEDGGMKATCSIGVFQEPEMISVDGGTFSMGCTGDDCNENELPLHNVTLSSFKIAKYETTQEEWLALMGKGSNTSKGDEYPIESVTWHDVQEYIKKLNALTEKNYRLPTEAEWEYAARGGNKSKGYMYSGSDDKDEVAWHSGNTKSTQKVGTKKPNELGIYDMSGNVLEWCNDWYGAYSDLPQNNPTGPSTGTSRSVRGGCFSFELMTVWERSSLKPTSKSSLLGFRLLLPQ